MLKIVASGAGQGRHQCLYCPVRRTGLCSAFADSADLDASGLEMAHLPIRVLKAGDCIYRQGETKDLVYNIVSGWVGLSRSLSDGRRHVSQILLPSEMFGLGPKGVPSSHSATALTTASLCAIPITSLDALRRSNPTLNERFIWMLQRDSSTAMNALTMTGQGLSAERVASLFWGLAARLSAPGPVLKGASLKAPLTQRLIADATGLTAIHVNRVIKRLRERRIVNFHDRILTIEDPQQLASMADADFQSTHSWSEYDRVAETGAWSRNTDASLAMLSASTSPFRAVATALS